VAVHLANSHIAKKIDAHYRTHDQVGNALNFAIEFSPTKVDQDYYLSYIKLYGLSRRARYLCGDDKDDKSNVNHFTVDKHFAKAIKNLDKFMIFYNKEYGFKF